MHSLAYLLAAAALLCATFNADAQEEATAWDALLRKNPSLIEKVADLERELLQLMTERQFQDYLQGADASEVALATGESLEEVLMRKGFSGFDLSWYTVDGGGGTMTGGDFSLTGALGQPDAGTVSGGGFTLIGGFFGIQFSSCGSAGVVFCDGFESGGLTEWSSSVGAI